MLVYFILEEDIDNNDDVKLSLLCVELVILGIFVIEIGLNLYSYGCKYLKDLWNLFDFIVILVSIAFVIIEMTVDNDGPLANILRIRGLFRVVRLFILMRKVCIHNIYIYIYLYIYIYIDDGAPKEEDSIPNGRV